MEAPKDLFAHVERIPRRREPPPRPIRHVTGVSYGTSRPSAGTIAKGIGIAAAVFALVAGAWGLAGALDDDTTKAAPWAAPSAPDVRPAPLSEQ